MLCAVALMALLMPSKSGKVKTPPPVKIYPMVGSFAKYTVKKGDTYYKIARSHNVSRLTLLQLNHVGGSRRPKPGKILLLPTMHIPPRNPGNGIVLNVPERAVYIFRDGKFKTRHACAIGQPGWETALGAYHLEQKEKNPTWHPTPTMIERENIVIKEVAAGPGNPLGDRWMGWSLGGYGFHSTNRPTSIGTAASHGCVRLYPEAAHAMYDQVKVGMPILSIYEPMTLGKQNGSIYLSVFGDVYDRGLVTRKRAQTLLAQNGLLPLVDEAQLADIVAAQEGYPRRLIGSDQKLTVNGQPLSLPAPLAYANGRWLAPAEAVAEAMGGQVTKTGADVSITAGRHTLVLHPLQTAVEFDGHKKPNFPCASIDGIAYAPLRSLAALFNTSVTEPTKGTLNMQIAQK